MTVLAFLWNQLGFPGLYVVGCLKLLGFFTVLQGELSFKMGTLSFAGFSLWCYVVKISR